MVHDEMVESCGGNGSREIGSNIMMISATTTIDNAPKRKPTGTLINFSCGLKPGEIGPSIPNNCLYFLDGRETGKESSYLVHPCAKTSCLDCWVGKKVVSYEMVLKLK